MGQISAANNESDLPKREENDGSSGFNKASNGTNEDIWDFSDGSEADAEHEGSNEGDSLHQLNNRESTIGQGFADYNNDEHGPKKAEDLPEDEEEFGDEGSSPLGQQNVGTTKRFANTPSNAMSGSAGSLNKTVLSSAARAALPAALVGALNSSASKLFANKEEPPKPKPDPDPYKPKPPTPPDTPEETKEENNSKTWLWATLGSVGGLAVIVGLVFLFIYRRQVMVILKGGWDNYVKWKGWDDNIAGYFYKKYYGFQKLKEKFPSNWWQAYLVMDNKELAKLDPCSEEFEEVLFKLLELQYKKDIEKDDDLFDKVSEKAGTMTRKFLVYYTNNFENLSDISDLFFNPSKYDWKLSDAKSGKNELQVKLRNKFINFSLVLRALYRFDLKDINEKAMDILTITKTQAGVIDFILNGTGNFMCNDEKRYGYYNCVKIFMKSCLNCEKISNEYRQYMQKNYCKWLGEEKNKKVIDQNVNDDRTRYKIGIQAGKNIQQVENDYSSAKAQEKYYNELFQAADTLKKALKGGNKELKMDGRTLKILLDEVLAPDAQKLKQLNKEANILPAEFCETELLNLEKYEAFRAILMTNANLKQIEVFTKLLDNLIQNGVNAEKIERFGKFYAEFVKDGTKENNIKQFYKSCLKEEKTSKNTEIMKYFDLLPNETGEN